MIRILADELDAHIDAAKPTWRARAAAFTAELLLHHRFSDKALNGVSPPEWSDIKPALMELHGNKCAYCERSLETAHELDVEHFRPKNQVTPWNGPLAPPAQGRKDGYYWLAYELANYCVACKPCNSGLKADHFPILGVAGPEAATINDLDMIEQPLLIFPMGRRDADPESLIGWNGVTPRPLPAQGTTEYTRAETTIAFFELDQRPILERERATGILVLWMFLGDELDPSLSAAEQQQARERADRYLATLQTPMRACLKSFAALARADRGTAVQMIDALKLFLAGL